MKREFAKQITIFWLQVSKEKIQYKKLLDLQALSICK